MKTVQVIDNHIRHFADSAIGRDAMPLFLADHAQAWLGEIALAFRVGRLGKSVPAKFALRYVDAATVVMLLGCEGDPAWIGISDYAVTPGQWLPVIDNLADAELWQWRAQCAEQDILIEAKTVDIRQAINSAIALVSDYGTIKTGDIIVPSLPIQALSLQRDTIVQTSLNGIPTMRLKVK